MVTLDWDWMKENVKSNNFNIISMFIFFNYCLLGNNFQRLFGFLSFYEEHFWSWVGFKFPQCCRQAHWSRYIFFSVHFWGVIPKCRLWLQAPNTGPSPTLGGREFPLLQWVRALATLMETLTLETVKRISPSLASTVMINFCAAILTIAITTGIWNMKTM